MINKYILEKAILKAENNGYLIPTVLSEIFKGTQDESRNIDRCWKIIKIEDFLYFDNNGRCAEETLFFSVNDIIFSHEFAKAFFGDKKYVQSFNPAYYTYRNTDKKLWEEHLQNMILMNNDTRVRYLENWL